MCALYALLRGLLHDNLPKARLCGPSAAKLILKNDPGPGPWRDAYGDASRL